MNTKSEPLGAYPGHMVETLSHRPHSSNLYLTKEVNDLGRSVVQHKPLHKGENTQTSLAKTFDDPAMRPKVFHAPVVCVSRPPQPSLNIKDIEGAQPKVFAMGVQDKRDPRTQTYVPPAASHQLPPAGDPGPAAKDHIGVHDIEGTSSKPRCSALSTREACTMKSRDVERSHAGWRTEYRDQVPRHSETHDFQYNVSDINSYRPPKIKIIFQNPPQPAAPPPQPPPPPTTAQAPYTPPESSQSTLLHYTGLPTFQTRPDVLAEQQRVQKIADQPMMEVAAECRALAAGQQRDIRGIDMVVADAQALQKKKFTKDAHQARVSVSLTHKEEKAAALDALQHLNITEETGVKMLQNMKKIDRQGFGKLNVAETVHAMREAGVDVETAQIRSLVKGMRDSVGYFEYREMGKLLAARGFDSSSQVAQRSQSARPSFKAPPPGAKVSFRPASSHSHPQGPDGGVHTSTCLYQPTPADTPPYSPNSGVFTPYPAYSCGGGQARAPAPAPTSPLGGPAAMNPYGNPNVMAPSTSCDAGPMPGYNTNPNGSTQVGDTTYFPYKSDPYWFGGRGPSEEKDRESEQWKATRDHTHTVTQFQVSQGDALFLKDPGLAPNKPPGYTTKADANLPVAVTASTASASLKNGTLSPADLASTLKTNQPRSQTAAASLSAMVQRISQGKYQGPTLTSAALKPTSLGGADLARSSRPSTAPQTPGAAAGRMSTRVFNKAATSRNNSAMVKGIVRERQSRREDVAMVKGLL